MFGAARLVRLWSKRIRLRARGRLGEDREAGYAAVDALVALTILATTIVLALAATAQARKAAVAAAEAQSARRLLQFLAVSHPQDSASGRQQGFEWRVAMAQVGADAIAPGLVRCARSVEVRSLKSRRRYAATTESFCPQRLRS